MGAALTRADRDDPARALGKSPVASGKFCVYIFVVAFGGAALARFMALLASLCLWSLNDGQSLRRLLSEYLPYGIHLAFAEALLTGMIVTIAVVYKPQWISTFDDKRYLRP